MEDNKVISLADKLKKTRSTKEKMEEYAKENEEKKALAIKVFENIKKLPQYRGEVITKNNIRNLPDVSEGEIYWVSSEDKAYVIAHKDKKKIELKALDETATLSTGISIYEMNKSIISKEPTLDLTKGTVMNKLIDDIVKWFNETAAKGQYWLAYGKDIHYLTLFHFDTHNNKFTNADAEKIIKILNQPGDLISIDPENDRLEIWIRTKDSLAELIYLFRYDSGLVDLDYGRNCESEG